MSGDRSILNKSGETSSSSGGGEIHAVALGGGVDSITPAATPIVAQGVLSPEFVAPRYTGTYSEPPRYNNNNEYNQYGVQTNVYTQQPGQPVVIYAQGTTALPPVNMPQQQYVGQPFAPQQVTGPPTGYWRDGICDCCSNIWPSCCCTSSQRWMTILCIILFCLPHLFHFLSVSLGCLHGAWITAQISQKINFIPFRYIITAYLALLIVAFVLSASTGAALWLALPAGAVWLLGLFLRLHFTKVFLINTHGTILEFMNAFCCCCCSIAQMSRHLMGYNKVFDGDSDPEPRDYYHQPAPGYGHVHPTIGQLGNV